MATIFSRLKNKFSSKGTASLAGGALSLSGSKFLTLMIGTVSSMMMARLRTQDDYGTYTALVMSIRTLSVFLMMGLPNSINYFLARAKNTAQKQHFLSVYYTFSTVLSAIIGATLVLALPWVSTFFSNPELKNYAYFLAICPWLYITEGVVDHLLIAYGNTRALARFRVFHSVGLLSIIPLAELLGPHLDPQGRAFPVYMVFYVIAEGIFAAAAYVFARRYSGALAVRFDFKMLSRILAFSLPIGLASSVSTLNGEIDKLFIGGGDSIFAALGLPLRGFTPADLAVYEYGSRSLPFYVIPAAITSVLTPLIVRMVRGGRFDGAIRLWNRVVEFSFGILSFATAVLIAFAPQVVELLYSEKYLASVPVFIIFRLTLLLRVTYFGMLLNATGRTRFIFVSSCCSLGVNILLNSFFFFCTDLGPIGLAISTVVSSAAMNAAQLFATCRVTKSRFRDIMPWGRMGVLLMASFSLAFAGRAAMELVHKALTLVWPTLGDTSTCKIALAVVFGIVVSAVYLLVFRKYIKMLWTYINSFKMANASTDVDEEDNEATAQA